VSGLIDNKILLRGIRGISYVLEQNAMCETYGMSEANMLKKMMARFDYNKDTDKLINLI
jgi:hypothetical protein